MGRVVDRPAARLRRAVPDRDRLSLDPQRGRARHGRSEDAGDDRRVPRLEAHAVDADAGVAQRHGDRRRLDRGRARDDEIRAAVRLFPRHRRGGRGDRRPGAARLVSRPVVMNLTPSAYTLLGLTALVACLVAVVVFALLRFSAAAAETRRAARGGPDTALLSAALEEAVRSLKAQERATAARADASERLSGEIISSLTAGLLVVGLNGDVKILNPAGRRMLHVPDGRSLDDYRRLLGEPALSNLIDECLATGKAVV